MLQKLKNWISSFFEEQKKEDIPENLDQAVRWLKENMPESQQKVISNGNLEIAAFHHSLGRWMRNNWGLWTKDSKLYTYFERMGIRHADDMSGIILEAFQSGLRNEFFDLKEEVNSRREYWKDQGVNPDKINKEE